MSISEKRPISKGSREDVFQRILDGDTILPSDPQIKKLIEASYATRKLIFQINNTVDQNEIMKVFSQIVGKEIENVALFTPIFINYGKHIHLGKNIFINFDCTFLALGGITIEDDVLIGPKVSLITENHPLDPGQRKGLVGRSILIKRNAWIGANATILPGVTIGENSIVAAGAVVSKDVPDNTVVGGVPAKVIKSITF